MRSHFIAVDPGLKNLALQLAKKVPKEEDPRGFQILSSTVFSCDGWGGIAFSYLIEKLDEFVGDLAPIQVTVVVEKQPPMGPFIMKVVQGAVCMWAEMRGYELKLVNQKDALKSNPALGPRASKTDRVRHMRTGMSREEWAHLDTQVDRTCFQHVADCYSLLEYQIVYHDSVFFE